VEAFLAVFFWVGMAAVNGLLATEKKKSVTAIVLTSLFLTPVFAYLYLLAAPVKTEPSGSTAQ